ncbi:MAG: xanthine dehydrogenase family protein molybdopterin-binding subunit [Dehalococcoidaceae bacterium]|nr:xanthine dehydrogenase family protein molybdopterin-binding subunit [Dehalococcoidaceae bacterium]
MADYAVVGKAGNKEKTIVQKLTGRLDYADDRLPGQKLVARTLLSRYANAEVTAINTSAAEALPGVKAVITYDECPMLYKSIRRWGQEIAAVAAVDNETATRALELIQVTYQEGNQISDVEEAMKPGAPLTGVWEGTNIRTSELLRGDVEAGFAQADQEFTETAGWTNFWQHKEMEPWSATTYWVGDDLYVWTTSQNPFGQRNTIKNTMGWPMHKIHLISHGSGSGHGNKHGANWIIIAAVLAKKAGMPVSYHLTRFEQCCSSTAHQNKGKLEMRVGVKNDGTITAVEATYWADGCSGGATTASGMDFGFRYTYNVPHAKWTFYDIATNTPLRGAFRCVADPPGDALYNLVMDKVADKLGMDPLEFRIKNLVAPDMLQFESKMPFSSMGIRQCLEQAAAALDWDTKWHQPGNRTLSDGRLHGIGIAGHIDSHGQMSSPCGAILNLTKDGKCLIAPGQSHNAGSINAHCHHVAEVLGMKYEDVHVGDWGHTDVTSEGGSEGGSTRCITLGSAYVEAALDARAEAFAVAAGWMGLTPDKLSAGDGLIFETANPTNSKTWVEVAGRFSYPIIGKGYSWPKKLRRQVLNWPVGTDCEVRGQMAQAVEIAVDPDTGQIEVLNMASAIDCGQAIYRSGFNKGCFGGHEIIMGETLMYEQVIDYGNGASMNPNFWQNAHVTAMDIHPEGFNAIAVETDDACGPHGCKGVGEPEVSALACMANAVYNATGVWIDSLPITPDKVLQALGKA